MALVQRKTIKAGDRVVVASMAVPAKVVKVVTVDGQTTLSLEVPSGMRWETTGPAESRQYIL